MRAGGLTPPGTTFAYTPTSETNTNQPINDANTMTTFCNQHPGSCDDRMGDKG